MEKSQTLSYVVLGVALPQGQSSTAKTPALYTNVASTGTQLQPDPDYGVPTAGLFSIHGDAEAV